MSMPMSMPTHIRADTRGRRALNPHIVKGVGDDVMKVDLVGKEVVLLKSYKSALDTYSSV